MAEDVLTYTLGDPIELNLSYMPFVKNGGLFIPTQQSFALGDTVLIDLQLPAQKDAIRIEGKVIWITPKNALHQVVPGIGVQFIGSNNQIIRKQIETLLDTHMDVGGYTYGMTDEGNKK